MEHTGANPYTRGVAEFVSGLRYEAIPDAVRDRIKLLILDSFGCALYGADLRTIGPLRRRWQGHIRRERAHIRATSRQNIVTARGCSVG